MTKIISLNNIYKVYLVYTFKFLTNMNILKKGFISKKIPLFRYFKKIN